MRFSPIILLAACACGIAAEDAKPAVVKPYPLDHCLLMDNGKVDKDSVTEIHQGQEFRFCCKGCIRKFKKDPDKYVKLLAEEVAKQPRKDAAPAK
jgi:YHS domain-containing protein